MSERYLILGGGGQLAQALQRLLPEKGIVVSQRELDITSPTCHQQLDTLYDAHGFSVLYNAAAYTQVDKAEEEKAQAFAVNAEAVQRLGEWCKAHDVVLVHYSTDYVFDGAGDNPRSEDAPTAPANAYGASKLAGEQALDAIGGRYLTFRTSWVYDASGKNFVNTMLRLMAERESINVVADQIGAPTYALHLAQASIEAVAHARAQPSFPSGIYHLCGGGEVSWYGFAQAIYEQAKSYKLPLRCQSIQPILTTQYPTPAKRPLNSRLDCTKARNILGVVLPNWQDGLKQCFREKYGH
ncbi:MAG: dTDP-4-dehydrorhamnose reductase [Rickettsiales bacterium]|nr:dTDP-4-dehydrorhamnose reductase [Rickettsiales bacterium]